MSQESISGSNNLHEPQSPPTDPSCLIWQQVRARLTPHAYPDSRFHHDFSVFIPDFQGSASAADHIASMDCYRTAKTIFTTPDNSLQNLRYRALRDGKKLVVATYELRRGFLLLDPRSTEAVRFEYASCADGMEKPGIGRHVTLAKLQEEGVQVDLYIAGSWVVSQNGMPLWRANDMSSLSWHMLADIGVLSPQAPTLTLVHSSQVLQAERMQTKTKSEPNDVQYDFVVTESTAIHIPDAVRPPLSDLWLDRVSDELIHAMPPLQELKGIKIMERIMREVGLGPSKEVREPTTPNAEEQMGIDIATRILKGYRV
ncbi:uncharacterized protein EI97DRAFT_269671 [Westerdykella ornata]|uniref:Uncharacterized protein n=1 Tax=Westerdykella ornata TaxID=318751 RepID=A0A6A6J711_WESOR|nr:uncharacterized protein EI97DRAFT_269671 [Westerdykella ornata]KAF2271426.1 hypothetical protein EI97DRAFT_269671 [Westerdykella ornata]